MADSLYLYLQSVAHTSYAYYLYGRFIFEVVSESGNVDIQTSQTEKIVISPMSHEQL